MSEAESLPKRVNDLEKNLHTHAHRIQVLEDSHKDTPSRLTVVEMQVAQIPQVLTMLGKHSEQMLELKDDIKSNQQALKVYLSWVAGAVGSLTFLINYGEKILKFLSKGGL